MLIAAPTRLSANKDTKAGIDFDRSLYLEFVHFILDPLFDRKFKNV